jgi:CDP-diacylglycerol---glycerol-3-phosphate 3-phosphatidyltransferase
VRDFYTFPNLLSLTRVGLGAMAALWIASGSRAYLIGAVVLIALGELTDFLDGYLARRSGAVTEFGKSLDTTCDAIFHLSIFLALLIVGWMPLWAAVVIYAAEIAMPYLRSFSKQLGGNAPPRMLDAVRSAAHGITQIAVVLIMLISGRLFNISGIEAVPAVFALDVLVILAILTANIWPLFRAYRAQR